MRDIRILALHGSILETLTVGDLNPAFVADLIKQIKAAWTDRAGSCRNPIPAGFYGDEIDDNGNITARM